MTLSEVNAYIDHNPVRAELVAFLDDYWWFNSAEALAGGHLVLMELDTITGVPKGARSPSPRSADCKTPP